MSRLKQTPIIEDLKSLRADIDQLKQSQYIGGDSLTGYLTYTGASYDWSYTMPAYGFKSITVTFTPASPNTTAIVDMFVYQALNNSAVMANAAPPWSDATAYIITGIQKLPPVGTSSKWFIGLWDNGGSGPTVYLKFVFNGSDTGTFTVV